MTDPNAQPPEPPAYPPAQPAYPPVQPGYAPPPAVVTTEVPGKTLGIVGLVFAFVFTIVGLILSIVAATQTRAYNRQTGQSIPNTPAKVGIILSSIFLGLGIIIWIIVLIFIGVAAANGTVSYSSH